MYWGAAKYNRDYQSSKNHILVRIISTYDNIADVPESLVWVSADFQSGSRVLKKVF